MPTFVTCSGDYLVTEVAHLGDPDRGTEAMAAESV
jgi:hypothetical protein